MPKQFCQVRPKTVTETKYRYQQSDNPQSTNTFIKTNSWAKNQNIFQTYDQVDNNQSRVLLLHLPNNSIEGNQNKKIRPFSRENMQMMNKKYRQIRSTRYSSSLGIFDAQNDRRLLQPRTSNSSQAHYELATIQPQFNPMVKSFRSYQKLSKHKPQSSNKKSIKTSQSHLNQKNPKKKEKKQESKKILQRDYSDQIFIPEKQSETGHMINGFKSNLRKKCVEDNLHIMASVLRKKVKVLDKKQIMEYVNKIMTRNPFE